MEKEEEEEGILHILSRGALHGVVKKGIALLRRKGSVEIRGVGAAIARAITVSEIIQRKIKDVSKTVSISRIPKEVGAKGKGRALLSITLQAPLQAPSPSAPSPSAPASKLLTVSTNGPK